MIRQLKLNPQDTVKHCPFCGGVPTLRNTHTASYWLECSGCDTKVGGKVFGYDKYSIDLTLLDHQKAKTSAIEAWNKRVKLP